MDLFRVTLALVTVFGLLGSLYFVTTRAKTRTPRLLASAREACSGKLRFGANRSQAGELEILRRVNLTPTHQLHLVKTLQREFLLCTHPQGCTLLTAQDTGALADNQSAAPPGVERYAS